MTQFNIGRDVYFTDAQGNKKKLADELVKIGTGGGSGSTNLDGLSDVDTSTTPPVEGNVLKYQGGVWKPGTDTIGEGGSGSVVSDSTVNGNILIDGVETKVYDDTTLVNNQHAHSNMTELDRLGISTNDKLTIDGVEQTSSGSTGEVLLGSYTHTSNIVIQPSALDLATGAFTTASPHGLVENDPLILDFDLNTSLTNYNPTIMPKELFNANANSWFMLKAVEVTETTFKVKTDNGDVILTYPDAANTSIDVTKFRFEKHPSTTIQLTNLNIADKRRVKIKMYGKNLINSDGQDKITILNSSPVMRFGPTYGSPATQPYFMFIANHGFTDTTSRLAFSNIEFELDIRDTETLFKQSWNSFYLKKVTYANETHGNRGIFNSAEFSKGGFGWNDGVRFIDTLSIVVSGKVKIYTGFKIEIYG